MHPRLVARSFHHPGWVYEEKYEAYVAKDQTSPYVGGLTLKWLKIKQANYREGERGWEPAKK